MAGEWPQTPLSDLTDSDTPVTYGVVKPGDEDANGILFIRGGDIADGRVLTDQLRTISKKVSNQYKRTLLRGGEIVMSLVGNPGQVAIVPESLRGANIARQAALIRLRECVDSRFVMYFLMSRIGQDALGAHSRGSVQQVINLRDLKTLRIPTPPLAEQRAIAHILGTLDDKIELNRRMSETLEAMARALFKSWFVDFDPVRAKLNPPSPPGRGAGGEGAKPPLPAALIAFARQLRGTATDAETLLWRLLRDRRVAGAKFRRQHPFPPYILDFYCHEHRLAIELDGGHHSEEAHQSRDAQRSEYLARYGIRVLRFWNNEVLQQTEAVMEAIYQAVSGGGEPSPPTPLPQGEGSGSLPQALADLFPARLVDSELGEIPEGWGAKPIGGLAEIVGGSTPKTERAEYWEGGTHHWVTPKDLSGLSMPVLLNTERKITDAGLAQVSSGLLPAGTVLLSSRAPIGYLAIAEMPVAINQGFIGMKPRPGISNLFLLRWAAAAHDEIVSYANGSTFLEISKSAFRPILAVAPPTSIMDAFDRLSRPMYRKVVEHERESRTLAALRDTLLPKLISGELRVADAEKFIGKVA
ncbi:MAG: DUF559 domain-containing protein [Immundisolibacter sp.]|uniref:DUF559 domain-containing protein n=1 Tax=Immundisolibacter sp. TaxID=1934948 RepID=UPI003D0BF6AB